MKERTEKMGKKLILAEKPSVGRDIGRVLACKKKDNRYMENDQYIVTWAMGHLIELAGPEKYNKKYSEWKLADLPILPDVMETQIIKNTQGQYSLVNKLLHRKDVSGIIIATDAGREGELVARWILEKSGIHKPLERLWISSVTDKAIREGFNSLKSGKEYENLFHAAVARAKADWYVGINATRALTTKYNARLSCGRVQTPTLALIAKREADIRSFKPKSFWEILLDTSAGTFKLTDEKNSSSRIFSKEKAESIHDELSKFQEAPLTEKRDTQKSTPPPLLYDLTELQREANKRYGFSAKQTLSILQGLYERHKILTYPRTDSKYLTKDVAGTIKERLAALRTPDYASYVREVEKTDHSGKRHIFNDAKVTDHHAIIPTEETIPWKLLSKEEDQIFRMVAERFLASLMPEHRYVQTQRKIRLGQHTFVMNTILTSQMGWKKVSASEEKSQSAQNIEKGDAVEIYRAAIREDQTKPPKPFTEGTLLGAMENPSKYMASKDQNLAKILENTGGLGTVATRADIIDKLFSKFYIEKKDQYLHVTQKGIQLLDLVPDVLKAPDLTAQWERKLENIKNGQLKMDVFIQEILAFTKELILQIKQDEGKFVHTNRTGDKCPKCGSYMLKEKGKNATVLVCSNRECNNKIRLEASTKARCPQCKKRMKMTGSGENQTFVCSCGYREKLTAFKKRKGKEHSGVSKKEARKFLNKQEEAPINDAMAEALAKWKQKDN